MARPATAVTLTNEDRATLEGWVRATTTEQRLALRARIVLAAAKGESTQAIAARLDQRPATVSEWRRRYAQAGLVGLQDKPRSGRPRQYLQQDEQRILHLLDQDPPAGYAEWSGPLLAQALGDVSADFVWQVLRDYGISLQQRHSWCVSTDPDFATKAADITGLYLAPPENAIVICVDEKPHIQALERAQGYLRLPNGLAITGFAHEYKRHGTTTLFAALNVATGLVKAGHYQRRRRREFLDFMNELVRDLGSEQQIHVILDNLNTHKPKRDRWLARHRNVQFHYTPTHASWLNQIEIWFSILARAALRNRSFKSPREVRQAIDQFVAAHNQDAAPFEWKKAVVHQVPLANSYANLRK
jgi:transposase